MRALSSLPFPELYRSKIHNTCLFRPKLFDTNRVWKKLSLFKRKIFGQCESSTVTFLGENHPCFHPIIVNDARGNHVALGFRPATAMRRIRHRLDTPWTTRSEPGTRRAGRAQKKHHGGSCVFSAACVATGAVENTRERRSAPSTTVRTVKHVPQCFPLAHMMARRHRGQAKCIRRASGGCEYTYVQNNTHRNREPATVVVCSARRCSPASLETSPSSLASGLRFCFFFPPDRRRRRDNKNNRERSNALKSDNTRCERSGTFARRDSRAHFSFADSKLRDATVRAGRAAHRCEPAPLDGAIAFHARQREVGIRAVTGEGKTIRARRKRRISWRVARLPRITERHVDRKERAKVGGGKA